MRLPSPDPNAPLGDFDIKDPNLRAAMGLPPLVQPAQPLGGLPVASPFSGGLSVSPMPAQSAPVSQGPLGNVPQSGLTTPQPPTAPDTSADRLARGILLRSEATTAVNPYTLQGAQNDARVEGLQAQLTAFPQHDPNNAAFHWNPITPQSLGAPQQAPIPTRPAPGHDPMSMGLAALASIFDPRGAGNYSAAPLQAGIDVMNTQYNDRQRQFVQAQQQMNAQYEAQRANAEQGNRFGLINQQEQHGADVNALGDQQRLQAQQAGLLGNIAGGQALSDPLSDMADRTTHGAVLGADVSSIDADIQAKQLGYKNSLDLYKDEYGPYAKYLQNMATVAGRQGVADTAAGARVQSAQITGDSRETVGSGHDDAHLQGIDVQQSGANSRNAATNATSAANNIRNNTPDDGPTGAAAKDPAVSNMFRDYMQKDKNYRKLQLQNFRAPNPKLNAVLAEERLSDDVHAAWTAYDTSYQNFQKTQTATPGTSGNTPPARNATRPGAPAGGGANRDPLGILR